MLRYVSQSNHLVAGCETGHDAAVPFLHYFEGMLSLGAFLTPDRSVQQSTFNNGIVVTVNFGTNSFTLPSERTVSGLRIDVAGLRE